MKTMNLQKIIMGACIAPLSLVDPVTAQNSESPVSSNELSPPGSISNMISAPETIEDPLSPDLLDLKGRSPETIEVARENEREHQIEILDQTLELANSIENVSERIRFISDIAIKYADFGQVDRAFEVLLMAQELANAIEDPQEQTILLSEIYRKDADLQPRDIAAERLTLALELANTVEDPQKRTQLLSAIALKLAELGQTDRAAAILAETQETIALDQIPEEPQLFPFQPIPWTGRVGLSSNFFSGNKTTSIASFSFGLERKWPTNEFDLGLSLTNDFDDSRVDPQADNQFKGGLDAEYRHHATARWQYFINSGVRRDELDNINVRSSIYTGPGINLWRAPGSRTFDMQLGLGVRFEDSNRRSNDFDAPVAQYRLRYKDVFFDSLRLRQFLTFELPVGDTADYYIESSTDLAVPITGGWSFTNFLRLRYAGQPTLGNPNLRVDLKTGLEYKF